MELTDYPEDQKIFHKQQHEKLVSQIFEVNEDISSNNPRGPKSMKDFLSFWLSDHILTVDKELIRYCRKHRGFEPSGEGFVEII